MKKTLLFALLGLSLTTCTKDNMEDYELLIDKFEEDKPFYGRWEREVGANGDYTEIAIGNITGEDENRVYMCEKNGSLAGLYKGYLIGNTITWDAQYGVPDFVLSMEGDRMVSNVPSCPVCLPTYYDEDPWDGECGPL